MEQQQGYPTIHVLKKSGEAVLFNPNQLRHSLERSGAGEKDIRSVLKKIMVECKFHSSRDTKSDVKVPLYIHSRFDDIRKELSRQNPGGKMSFEGWLVTNTRFTEDAIRFGRCAGLHLVSWDYPEQSIFSLVFSGITSADISPRRNTCFFQAV